MRGAGDREAARRGWRGGRPARGWVRLVELIGMFLVGPFVYVVLFDTPRMLFPALWGLWLTCLFLLLRDRRFLKRRLCNARGLGREVGLRVVPRFVVLAGLIWVFVWWTRPEMLFGLIRERPVVWMIVMIGYPLLSVYPQEVVWRAYFFHRYRGLLGRGWAMILGSGVTFGYAHIVFENWIAVAFTLVGGLLFADTYGRSKSTLAASIEHALYGCFIFTIGLGTYFYSGAG